MLNLYKKPHQKKNEQLINDINVIVCNALRVLITAGKPLNGFKDLMALFVEKPERVSMTDLHAAFKQSTSKLKAAHEIVKGVVTDNDGKGYKDVTMRAFLNGLQTIFKDLYLAAKLLETDFTFDDKLQNQLAVIDNRNYILKTLGLNEEKIANLNRKIKAARQPDIAQLIRDEIHDVDKADRIQRIQFMAIGASCYLPFSDLEDGDTVDIPVKNNQGSFELKSFQNEKINMRLGVGDPYFAHLLTPTEPNDTSGQAKLLFMGTNPMPTTKALKVTLKADAGKGSVGEFLIDSSQILFEKCIKEQYKSNLKKRIIQAIADNNHNMQDIWRGASIEVSGQSLGGALSLHLGVQYPFMVRMSAFEPALLMDDKNVKIEMNLAQAHAEFCCIVDEMIQDDADLTEMGAELKAAFPVEKEALRSILVEDNIAIIQFSDIVPQYGTCAPPATFYHIVDEKNPHFLFKDIKHKLSSHALAFSGADGVKIIKLTPEELQARLSSFKREEFTQKMRVGLNGLNSAVNLFGESSDKTPRRSTRKTVHHAEEIKKILKNKIEKKLSMILEGLKTIDNPNSWKRGNHLNEKIKELNALIDRARALSFSYNISQMVTRGIEPLKENNPSPVMKTYLDLFEIGLKISSISPVDFQNACLENLENLFNKFTQEKENVGANLPQIFALYELLEIEHQAKFLDKVLKPYQSEAADLALLNHDFCKQLSYRTLSKIERKRIKDLINEKPSPKPSEADKIPEVAKILVFSDTSKDEKYTKVEKETPKNTEEEVPVIKKPSHKNVRHLHS